MDTNGNQEKVVRIKVRDADEDGVRGGDDGGASAPRHPAGGVEPPVLATAGAAPSGPAEGDGSVFTLDLSPAESPAASGLPGGGEEPTVARSRYLESARENLRLGAEVKRLQAEAYQSKAAAQGAESRTTELKEQLQRSQAEFQNYRRRVDKERDEALRYAHADLIRELLPVLDNFERAMKVAPKGEGSSEFYKGIELIYKQIQDVLAAYDLKPLAVLGELFDPNVHEAVTRAPHPTLEADRVITEHQKGYLHKERLLRPALVGVSTGTSDGPEDSADGGAEAPASSGGGEDRG